jgi:putative ABC transport system substrate-binding protein
MRRIGALMLYAENDRVGESRFVVFRKELEKLGWTFGRNLTIDFHWGVGDDDWIRAAAAQLLARAPDLVLANGSATVRPMQQATHTDGGAACTGTASNPLRRRLGAISLAGHLEHPHTH